MEAFTSNSLYCKKCNSMFPITVRQHFTLSKYEWDTAIYLGFRIIPPKGPCNSSKHGKFRPKMAVLSHTGEGEASHKSALFKVLHAQMSSCSLPPPFWKRKF